MVRVKLASLDGRVGNLETQVSALQNFTLQARTEARRGIAAAASQADPMMPSANGKTTINMRTAYYRGEAGVGITIAHRLDTDRPIVVEAGYSNGGGSEHVGHLGVGFEF